jgi:hypothetical protein
VVFGSDGVDSGSASVEFGSEICVGGGEKRELMFLEWSVEDEAGHS